MALLVRLARASAPAEAFGLLGAQPTRNGVRLQLFPMAALTGPTGFRVTPRTLALGRRALRRQGLVLAGCYHTHPTARSSPSDLDRASMARFPVWWLIYAPRAGRATILRSRAGILEKGRLRVG